MTCPPFITNFTRSISVTSAERIAADGDDVGELAFLEAADAIRPAVVEDAGRGQKRRLQRLRRRHAPFHEVRELIGLLAVRIPLGDGAAAERRRDARREQLPERHLAHGEARDLAAGELAIGLVEADQVVDGHHHRELLLLDGLQQRVIFVELEQVHRQVDARVDARAHAFAAVRVARDLQSHAMRFVDDGLDFFEGERRDGDERAVGPELAQLVADEILRRVDLGPVGAVQLQLAHGRAREPRAVDVLVLGEAAEEARHGVRRLHRRARVQRLSRRPACAVRARGRC